MAVISVIVEAFFTFRNGKKIVIPTGCPYIKEIGSSFACF